MGGCNSKLNLPEKSKPESVEDLISKFVNSKSQSIKLQRLSLNCDSLPKNLAELTHVKDMDFSNNVFRKLPAALPPRPRTLDFSHNPIETLPTDLCYLQSLETLVLQFSELKELPPAIGALKSLTRLELEGNKLTSLPPELGALVQLQNLVVSNNNIVSFPEEIFRIGSRLRKIVSNSNMLVNLPSSLGHLVDLQHLNLSCNKLALIPAEIGNLSQLATLQLKGNDLEYIPDSITELRSLIELDLEANRLQFLPHHLGRCSALERLILEDNQLKRMPDITGLVNLKYLKIRNNNLENVPPELGKLTKIKSVDFNGNPILSVSDKVMLLKNVDETNFPIAQEVCKGLFLGNLSSARNRRFLDGNKIRHVVNFAAGGPDKPGEVENNEAFRDDESFVYLSFNIADPLSKAKAAFAADSMMNALHDGGCLEFIHQAIQSNNPVLCHCHEGVSRSTTVCVAYLVEYANFTMSEAIKVCQKTRSCVKMNPAFSKSLQQYYGGMDQVYKIPPLLPI